MTGQRPPDQEKRKPLAGKRAVIGVVAGVFLILVVVLALASGGRKETESTNETTNSGQTNTYEIINKGQQGTICRIAVYTTEKTDAGLIKINDELLEEYLDGNTRLSIDYFDDKELVTEHFSKSNVVSEAEADALHAHYVAAFTYDESTGRKELRRNKNGGWVEIKTY